jgi:hypothetical protein
MKPDFKFKFRQRKKLTSLLGLALDGSRLDGVVLKLVNGALTGQQNFTVALALDPLTAAPELVAREIRNHLDAAGIRERHCVFGVPLKWVLTMQTELPALPEADAASLLQLEVERGFHADVATLQTSASRSPLADGKTNVLIAGIPGTHLARLEQVLAAAKLKPVSFALGIAALESPLTHGQEARAAAGVLALAIGENQVGLQVTAGGGVVALRALEGAVVDEGSQRVLQSDLVAREVRVTLGQLPGELGALVKRIRIFGPELLAQALADALEPRFGPMGLKIEVVDNASPAFSLAAEFLTGQKPAFEFLPPKPGLIEQFVTKYSSGRLRTAGAIGASVGLLVGGAFSYQQIILWQLHSQWAQMAAKVGELEKTQGQIREYRSWYDGSFANLGILRQLTLAFPEDGSVTAKNIEIREGRTVMCSGTARDSAALLAVEAKLNAAPGISGVHHEQSRGSRTPIQFVFSFKFNAGGSHEN